MEHKRSVVLLHHNQTKNVKIPVGSVAERVYRDRDHNRVILIQL